MSLYNMLFGTNPNTDIILAVIGLKKNEVQRFRDCGLEEGGLYIYTRTGGGNRDYFPNTVLVESPYYLSDEDDDFDSTYATYHFRFPEEIADCKPQLENTRENGISPKLISWLLKTLERPETQSDKHEKIYNSQDKLWRRLEQSRDLIETNGHTVVPLTDDGMRWLLTEAEKNDLPGREGEFMPMSVRPYKVEVKVNVPKWNHEKDNLSRVKIEITSPWTIDREVWSRWYEMFKDKYPKAVQVIKEAIDNNP